MTILIYMSSLVLSSPHGEIPLIMFHLLIILNGVQTSKKNKKTVLDGTPCAWSIWVGSFGSSIFSSFFWFLPISWFQLSEMLMEVHSKKKNLLSMLWNLISIKKSVFSINGKVEISNWTLFSLFPRNKTLENLRTTFLISLPRFKIN